MARTKTLYLGTALALLAASAGLVTHVRASVQAMPKQDPLGLVAVAVDSYASVMLPQLYGGVAIDESKRTVRVLLTTVSATAESDIAAHVLDPSYLTFEQATYTKRELMAVQEQIQNDWTKLRDEGIDLTSVGQGIGRVNVTVSNTGPAAAEALVAEYGEAVHVQTGVEPVATTGRWDPPPYYGGMELDDIGNASTAETEIYHDCTNGYVGFRLINGVAFYQLITAGHCFVEPNMVYHTVENGGAPIALGQVNMNLYVTGSDADALSADIDSGYQSVTSQIITAPPYTHNVDYLDAAPVNGLGVCKSGVSTDQSCNFTVNSTNATIAVREQDGTVTTLYDQVTACCDAVDYGDSGSPVYHYYQPQNIAADGLLSAGFLDSNGNFTGEITYSFIQNVRNALGVFICTSTPTLTGC